MLVIVLGIILGVADRVGVHYAEQQVAKNVATELASRNITSAPPEVTITGFPVPDPGGRPATTTRSS